jgi:hypothetical protein
MSIPGDKKIRYILPIVPALALLATYPFLSPKDKRYFFWLGWLLVRLFILIPIVIFVGLRRVMAYATTHGVDFHIDYLLVTQLLFVSLAFSALVFVCFGKKKAWRDTGILFIGTATFVASYLMVVEPIEQFTDRTHVFVTAVELARKHSHANLVFYRESSDGLPIKYIINMPTSEVPIFINNENQLLMYEAPAFFVTSEAYFKELSAQSLTHFRVIDRDKIGHGSVVVFTNS